jgi:hypothetical protein
MSAPKPLDPKAVDLVKKIFPAPRKERAKSCNFV